MCTYCEKCTPIPLVYIDCVEEKSAIMIVDNELSIHITQSYWHDYVDSMASIELNYCPKCGKKLKEN